MKIVHIKNFIIDDYKKIDNRVLDNKKNKQRPYLLMIKFPNKHDLSWVVPLSSPSQNKLKKKNKRSVFHHFINDNKGKTLAILQFNNMVPVKDGMYDNVDFSTQDEKYKNLLQKQFKIIKKDKDIIFDKFSKTLLTANRKDIPICCDFLKLANRCLNISNQIEKAESKKKLQ